MFVEVLDRAGRPVPGLTAADFALQEDAEIMVGVRRSGSDVRPLPQLRLQ